MPKTKPVDRVTPEQLSQSSKTLRRTARWRKVRQVALSILSFGLYRPKPVVVDVMRGIDRKLYYAVADTDRMSPVKSFLVIAVGVFYIGAVTIGAVIAVKFLATGEPW